MTGLGLRWLRLKCVAAFVIDPEDLVIYTSRVSTVVAGTVVIIQTKRLRKLLLRYCVQNYALMD